MNMNCNLTNNLNIDFNSNSNSDFNSNSNSDFTIIDIREFQTKDIKEMISIWNEVVIDGNAFPQENTLDESNGLQFFSEQSFTGVAVNNTNEVVGLYILHPNNIGRCGHICNASYAVRKSLRGHHIGEQLVTHCMNEAKKIGFSILQFNAVVESNKTARHLYEKLGFISLGTIRNGFKLPDGNYENICPYYINL